MENCLLVVDTAYVRLCAAVSAFAGCQVAEYPCMVVGKCRLLKPQHVLSAPSIELQLYTLAYEW